MHHQQETYVGLGARGNMSEKVTLRTSLTHIAVVCDDAALQALLPQVIVANTNTILRKQLLRLIIESPPNVRLVRNATSWNTTALQEEVMWLAARTFATL